MKDIPNRIVVDSTSFSEGNKVTFIKGIRRYTGIGLKEAKDLTECGDTSLELIRRSDDDESVREAICFIKQAGVKIKSGDDYANIINHVATAAEMAVSAREFGLASELIDVLKRCG